jgi:hypothetical protein
VCGSSAGVTVRCASFDGSPVRSSGSADLERWHHGFAGLVNVRYWHKADIEIAPSHVRFRGQSGHDAGLMRCLLLTQSGHSPPKFAVAHKTATLHQRCGRLLSSRPWERGAVQAETLNEQSQRTDAVRSTRRWTRSIGLAASVGVVLFSLQNWVSVCLRHRVSWPYSGPQWALVSVR